MKKHHILAAVLAMACSLHVQAEHNAVDTTKPHFQCKVIGVMDGDTLNCLTANKEQVRIRLANIDAPEKAQAFGSKARQKLSELAFSQVVLASVQDTDRYGRQIAEIYTYDQNGNVQMPSVNYQMVQSGLAWAYERYLRDKAYLTAQQQAQANKMGLWVEPNPIKPEDFRR